MTVLANEVGTLAAANVATILEREVHHPWNRLVEGGWSSLSADPEVGFGLRELLEVARVAGRSTSPTCLVTTLLAARWFELDEEVLTSGATIALLRDDHAVAPYAVQGTVVLDLAGSVVEQEPLGAEGFAEPMPLAVLPAETTHELGDIHAAELHAALSAVAVGCADAVADLAVAWAQTREQFGKPIMRFQAVRHHLANIHIARELAWTAAVACANDPKEAEVWSRQATRQAMTAIEIGIQVHGGVGFTTEVGLDRYLNHVLQIESVLGGLA